MFEKFTRANSRDFKQRYEGTYGFFRNEDRSKKLMRLDLIEERVCRFSDARGVEFSLNADTEKNIGFEFIPPKSRWYNSTDGNVYLVQRVAARQFSRGINGKNTAIYMLEDALGTLLPRRVDFGTLNSVYNLSVPPGELVSRLDEGRPFAISNQFAFSPQGGVYLYEAPVGTYTTDDRKHYRVRLDEPSLWRTEITDALRSLSKTVEVL